MSDKAYVDAIENYLDDEQYIQMMYAAYCRRCAIDPLTAGLIAESLPDGRMTYRFAVMVEDEQGGLVFVRPQAWYERLIEWIRRNPDRVMTWVGAHPNVLLHVALLLVALAALLWVVGPENFATWISLSSR